MTETGEVGDDNVDVQGLTFKLHEGIITARWYASRFKLRPRI